MPGTVFKKTKDYFKVEPNLPDYDKAGKSSVWKSAEKEIAFFEGKLNAAYNAIDRHVGTFRKNKIALFWEGDSGESQKFTFEELSLLSNKAGNLLKKFGVARGDRVFLFLPRIPALYFCFLGILKIGGVAGTLFSAFQEQGLFDRLDNSDAKVLITTSELAGRLKNIKKKLPHLEKILIVDEAEFIQKLAGASDELNSVQMDRGEYAFMLYTSGTTGKPKGVVHTHGAIVQQHLSTSWVLDIQESDTYWCTADPGWVTGIVYGILGIWSNGGTAVVHSGRFDPETWYTILEKYRVTIWYTAPTAVRMLMAGGNETVAKHDLSHLRHLASVGEPLNPEAIRWGLRVFKLPFHDTWWQTETGSIMIANYPCMDIKIGSMGRPFPGITAAIVDDKGREVPVGTEGNLAFKRSWPSMMHTIWRRPQKYDSYFEHGWYISGDRASVDKEGYFWFVGRADDVIKTSGERVGPFEVESALVEHEAVVEAGVIGKPDQLRGEIIKAFVVLKSGFKPSDRLKEELAGQVKKHLAAHAYPREIEFIDKLPKTRSGKIMRRILKAKELGLPIGDTSTLEEY